MSVWGLLVIFEEGIQMTKLRIGTFLCMTFQITM